MSTLATIGAMTCAWLALQKGDELAMEGHDAKAGALFIAAILCCAYIGMKVLREVVG